jgi:Flp pilus assembly protein TadD
MKISGDVVQLLSQIGYLACLKGNVHDGQMIMDSVEMNSSSHPATLIGVAISRIYASQYAEAVHTLNNVLVIDPDNMTAKTFLGIALSESGESEDAFLLFKEIVEKGNADNRAIASFYLGEMDVVNTK